MQGFDPHKLTYRHADLDYRLAGIDNAHVITDIKVWTVDVAGFMKQNRQRTWIRRRQH